MTQRLTLLLSIFVLLSSVHMAFAFDGNRKGFLLGGGLGLGVDTYTQELSDGIDTVKSDRLTDFSIGTDFKIGGGVSEQLFLYFHNQSAWFSIDNIFNDTVTIQSGVAGVGMTWFTSPEPRGFFLTATVGAAYWDTPFESDSDALTSLGAILGIGREFAPHWSVDASVLFGSPDRTESGITLDTTSLSVLITVTGIAY